MVRLPLSTIFTITVILTIASIVEAKQHTATLNVPTFRRSDSWPFVHRVIVNPGKMHIKAHLKFLSNNHKEGSNYDLELIGIPDSIWKQSLTNKCNFDIYSHEERARVRREELMFNFHIGHGNGYSQRIDSTI